MKGDTLMNDDLEREMRKIETEMIQKKRKAILKNLHSKQIKLNKQTNRSFSE
jgi:hypothetical protein